MPCCRMSFLSQLGDHFRAHRDVPSVGFSSDQIINPLTYIACVATSANAGQKLKANIRR